MDEEKYKVEKWMYFIPIVIQGSWIMWMYPVYELVCFITSLYNSKDNMFYTYERDTETFLSINLFVIILALILSIIIGKKLKKVGYEINTKIRLITISIHIILVIINLLVLIMFLPM